MYFVDEKEGLGGVTSRQIKKYPQQQKAKVNNFMRQFAVKIDVQTQPIYFKIHVQTQPPSTVPYFKIQLCEKMH
jgi:hypothetical protein